MKTVIFIVLDVIIVMVIVFICMYYTRIQTIASIKKISNHKDGYELYHMDIKYDYNIDNIIAHGIRDTKSYIQATMKEATPLLPISIDVPDFGCSAFSIKASSGDWLMGRNYDFKNNTSAMLLYCKPKKGYKSVALAALDDISVDAADESLKSKFSVYYHHLHVLMV